MALSCHTDIVRRGIRKLSKVMALACLVALVGIGGKVASAAVGPGDLGILDVPGTTYISNFVTDPFSDSYTFEVASSASFGAQLLSISFYDILGIDSFRTSLWDGSNLLAEMEAATFGSSLLSYSLADLSYSPLETLTQYELRVEGIATGTYGGKYKGSVNLASIAPVPEPEIYAMMAVGLGVMGWAARKQRRRQAGV